MPSLPPSIAVPDLLSSIQTVAIIGPGLIGGSFGLALRRVGFEGPILGVGESPYVETALQMRAISEISTLHHAAAIADLLYLSGTVDNILETIDLLKVLLRPGCLVTDVGSTKRTIMERAQLRLPPDSFVGGHPLAGKEKRGAENSDPELFRNRPYILTSRSESPHFRSFSLWLEQMGAQIAEMTAAQHDATVAFSSHLPQLLSTALAYTLAQHSELPITSVFGTGLTDMTRLALSSPGLWESILETNRDEVVSAIDEYVAALNKLRDGVATREVLHIFDVANAYAYLVRRQN